MKVRTIDKYSKTKKHGDVFGLNDTTWNDATPSMKALEHLPIKSGLNIR